MIGIFIFVVWVLFCVLVGKCAERWNRSFVKYLLLSILFSPLIMGIILLIMGKDIGGGRSCSTRGSSMKIYEQKCRSCQSIITDDYTRCPNCGGDMGSPSVDVDLSSVGKIAMTSSEDRIICPFCRTKIVLDILAKDFKNMNCTKCGKKIDSKNVLFED